MSENQILGGEPDRRVILRLTPQQAVVLTVHDHQILPSYGVLNDITEGGRASSTITFSRRAVAFA